MSRTPRRRRADQRARSLGRVVEAAQARPARAKLPVDAAELVRRYYGSVADEDLLTRDPDDLAGAALSHLEFAAVRKPGAPKMRIFNPDTEHDGWSSPHSILEIVNDDMPFLVNSVTLTINREGFGIHLTVHPVLTVRRNGRGRLSELLEHGDDGAGAVQESWIRVELTRETDPDEHRRLLGAIESSLADVRAAVEDWQLMAARLRVASAELRASVNEADREIVEESCALLDWMADDHFTLLGYREYRLQRGRRHDRLLPLPETGLGIMRPSPGHASEPMVLNEYMRDVARSPEPLVLTKANRLSTVHRPGYLHYVGIKIFDAAGRPAGEHRFLGLFTSAAYSRSARDIPVLRRKVAAVIERSGLAGRSHRGKALLNILETYPRDELFQIGIEDLHRIASGILNLQERSRVRLFVRRDQFRRFYSCLVYVPRDRFNTQVRLRIEALLAEGFGGECTETSVWLSASVLARLHVTVRTPAGAEPAATPDEIERSIEETVRTWHDGLRDALLERFPEDVALDLLKRYGPVFPAAYREDVTPREASFDIERLDGLVRGEGRLYLSLYRPPAFENNRLRFKIVHPGVPLELSKLLPMLENMGFQVLSERPYRMRMRENGPVYIQDLDLEPRFTARLEPGEIAERFHASFRATLAGEAENDGFNQLVLSAGFDWREAALMRAYCKYLVQTGMPFSQAYMREVLVAHPAMCRALIRLFTAQFDPDLDDASRDVERGAAQRTLDEELAALASLDEDRILRGFVETLRATLRTSFYQTDGDGGPKPYVSFKLDPSKITELPRPRPMFEIFVYSPRVEAVHLRGAKIARGGLRWSDRREDFRSEVLGLMKAQQVKNTVIVPRGAKGGFVCKQLPEGDREAVREEVLHCYRTFIRGMLDITDNIVGDSVVTPPRVRRLDGDDPYLVVAADKGTATFSDTANAVAADYGFWLGDAFASGGSAGYDHKKMGITARGGWEAVKRHFREIGIDVQTQPFTVAGIGDMSGDVFGNGMLLSEQIRLQAAFDHRHVFLDPDPDPATSHAERARLFALPRSSWADYDTALISEGGGVFDRSARRVELHPKIQRMLGVQVAEMTPPELIRAILRMPVDLLWNGGIGTYVKASDESHAEVGDRGNDATRVDGRELRCRVVGEGGNLGLTQRGRIEYALHGGRINTDFIDNSGGVDCSDREVNIKILLEHAIADGALARTRRNRLLSDMTEEVASLVLRNNYLQTQAISMTAVRSAERLSEVTRPIRSLETAGVLDRSLEFLPSEEEIEERRRQRLGLTRPEIAVILSYSKIALVDALGDSNVPEDPYLARELVRYFPARLQRRFAELIPGHRLRRQIIAMLVAGSMINRMGPVFALRAAEETGADPAAIARAYTIAREVTGMRDVWHDIESLDNSIQSDVQYDMMFETARQLRHASYWLLRRHGDGLEIEPQVARLAAGVQKMLRVLPGLATGSTARRIDEVAASYAQLGVPEVLARRMGAMVETLALLDVVEVAGSQELEVDEAARVYYELGHGIRIDWLIEAIEALRVEGRWQALARGTLRAGAHEVQRRLFEEALANGEPGDPPGDRLRAWLEARAAAVGRAQRSMTEIQVSGTRDFATLSVALEELRRLLPAP